jgi:hypothetical protein
MNARIRFTRIMTALVALMFLGATAVTAVAQTGSDYNYLLSNNCNNVDGLTVSLHVTQDMIADVTPSGGGSGTPNGGFAMQLNANPQAGQPIFWMQYGIIIEDNQAKGFIQYWDNAGVNNHGEPTIVNLPSNTIPAGWVLTIQLTNDSYGNVNSTTFIVTDNAGNVSTLAMPMPILGNNQPALSAIQTFQVDVVGPINWENSTFSSGAGYLTYSVASGELGVQTTQCPNGQELWTGETSNTYYAMVNPSLGASVTQPFITPFAGALASNMDTADNEVEVYLLAQDSGNQNLKVHQYAFNGSWTYTDVGASSSVPAAAYGSPIMSYDNTIYNAPEAFYLADDGAGNQDVEQLWGKTWSPTSLTQLTGAEPAAFGSGLVGFIDPIIDTDNVFYQGTDQHINLLNWSVTTPWTAEKIGESAPAAAFASVLSGHMTAQSEELFYVGTNQHIYELWRWSKNFDGWHTTDVTLANGTKPLAAIGSPLAGFYDSKVGTDTIFYIGTDQHVHEMLFSNSQWIGIDVTAVSGAPNAGPGSMLAAHLNTIVGSEEVLFVNANQGVQELWSWSSVTPAWNTANLFSGVVGSPVNADPGTPLATDIDSATNPARDELYYVGIDGAVHELWWSTATWQWTAATP